MKVFNPAVITVEQFKNIGIDVSVEIVNRWSPRELSKAKGWAAIKALQNSGEDVRESEMPECVLDALIYQAMDEAGYDDMPWEDKEEFDAAMGLFRVLHEVDQEMRAEGSEGR